MVKQFGEQVAFIDCTFRRLTGLMICGRGWKHSCRSGGCRALGRRALVLTDEHQGPAKVAMPMILATSAVHSWLTRKGLRTFCSINVRAAECIDPHYFAVLIGCGATTVNPYLAQDSIADRIKPRPSRRHADRCDAPLPRRHRRGPAENHVEDGHFRHLVLSRRPEL